MDKIDILIWAIAGGFAIVFAGLKIIWNEIKYIHSKLDRLDEKLTDIDRRVCRLEGAFSSKDCCMLKEDKQDRKAK